MAEIDGAYNCVTKSPMGDQQSLLTLKTDGDKLSGQNAGSLGTLEIIDGKVEGNRVSWKMEMKVPMPMTLSCQAEINGDALSGTVNAPAFGDMEMTGTRQSA